MEFEGIIKTHPATLHMDGTSPVTVHIHSPGTEILRWLHNQTVRIVIEEEYAGTEN